MENLERLAGSIAQVELLVASLKREGRDLAARLASSASERRQVAEDARAEAQPLRQELEGLRAEVQTLRLELEESRTKVRSLRQELEASLAEVRQDPELEARVQQAELESAELARRLDAAQHEHFEEKSRFESLIRQLEAQVMADRGLEQMPVASAEALGEARDAERAAVAARLAAEDRVRVLEEQLRELQLRQERWADAEAAAAQTVESLRIRSAEQERRTGALESAALDLERRLGESQRQLSLAPAADEVAAWKSRLAELEQMALRHADLEVRWSRLELEQTDLKRQKRELAAFTKERHALRRRLEELVSTLESVRLG